MVSRGAFPAQDMPDGASEAGTQQSDPCRSTTNWPSSLAMLAMPMLPISTAAHSAQAPSLVCAARGLLRATAIVTASARCTMLLGSRGRAGRGQTVGRLDSSRPATASRDGLCCFEQHRGRARGHERAPERAPEGARGRDASPANVYSKHVHAQGNEAGDEAPLPSTGGNARIKAAAASRLFLLLQCRTAMLAPTQQQPWQPGSPAQPAAIPSHPSSIPAPSQQRIPAAP
jgi:hypothetical protein